MPFVLASLFLAPGCGEKHAGGFAGSGTLETTEVTVSALTGGQIALLAKDEGDAVAAGDTLARIDVEKLTLQRRQLVAGLDEARANRTPVAESVKQAKDNLENIEKNYRRISGLFEKGTATQQQYDDASTKYRVASSQLASARAQEKLLDAKERGIEASIAVLDRQIRDGTVVAPLSGVIVEKYVEQGETVPPGGAVCKISDTKSYWLKIYVAERELARFKLGEAVTVKVDSYGKDLAAAVSWVSPEAEFTPKNVETRDARAELVYAVKVTIKEPPSQLKIGMPAEVYLK
ncbi:MAG TPA: efflux RND transporter periplasmic adaptor subunit [Candidatus Bathyarchaeia archaeon]|nr:efflux RND transporter periplasmic adaptor subunit [Candidatus Bathyarchaeia archaeon]